MKFKDLLIAWTGTGLGTFADYVVKLEFIEILQIITLILTIIFTVLKIIRFFKNKEED